MMGNCLACGGTLGNVLFSIPDLQLVDSFCRTPEESYLIPSYAIDLRQCEICSTIQIASPPDTSDIYRNYIYESSSSPDLSDHFSEYAKFLASFSSSNDQRVLEIGADDGLLLEKLSDVGFTSMVGVDPSPQTAQVNLNGVEIINDFFCEATVGHLAPNSFDIIIANNCFSHIPKLTSVLSLCGNLLEKSGILVVEVQSTLDLLEGVIFDYIYHEHYFYHTAHSFEKIAVISGLELYKILHLPTKGGTYRLLFGHPGAHPIDSSVHYWKFREELAEIHSTKPWIQLTTYLENIKGILSRYIHDHEQPFVGYGASATGTVLLNYMGIEKSITAIVDDNKNRQGLFAPRSGIPILSPDSLKKSDICIILAWRHSNYIIPRLSSLGISYVIPLPMFQTDG